MNNEVLEAAEHIRKGGIILYPTDTIWGIGCDATNPEAVDQIYRIKNRSDRKSMLVLVDGIQMLYSYLERVPAAAKEIILAAEKPTTIIYPGGKNLAADLLSEDGSIGIRITSDPFCLRLIDQIGKPIVSTSANFSGHTSPSCYREIDNAVRDQVDYVVKWRQEETHPSTPSTIIKLDKEGNPTVLRP